MEEITIYTPFIRLDAFLKFTAEVESGGEAKQLIQEGFVEVNGSICTQRTKKLYPGDQVTFNGMSFSVAGEEE